MTSTPIPGVRLDEREDHRGSLCDLARAAALRDESAFTCPRCGVRDVICAAL